MRRRRSLDARELARHPLICYERGGAIRVVIDEWFRRAGVAALAEEILGATPKAARWLRRPNRALGGKTPLETLDTDLGASQVETVLHRVEHGVFS
jgi:putative toxin-antitoxin system antitoxin component (TIGR02293 family)